MRQQLLRTWQWMISGDPESSPLWRALGTVLLTVNLLVNHGRVVPGWEWAVLATAFGGWLIHALCQRWRPNWGAAGLIMCAVLGAATVGPAADGAAIVMTCAAASMLSQQTALPTRMIVPIGLGCAVLLTIGCLWAGRTRGELLTYLAILVALMLGGLYRRQYLVRVNQTELLLEQTRRAQHEHARAAALDERARIAREMHDVLAHSLGALTIQLEVAEGLLGDKGDVDGALARLRRSRRLAADGLAEARGAVAALREDVPPLHEAVAELIERYRRDHHLVVDWHRAGTPRPLGSAATVSLLRTAREALTNAAKHAPGAAVTVTLDYRPDRVRLSVSNPPTDRAPEPVPGGGYGLTGMRERIALAGGTLSAGPHEGDGWLVTAEVPE